MKLKIFVFSPFPLVCKDLIGIEKEDRYSRCKNSLMFEPFVQPLKQVGLHHHDQQELPKKTPSLSRKKEASLPETSDKIFRPKYKFVPDRKGEDNEYIK